MSIYSFELSISDNKPNVEKETYACYEIINKEKLKTSSIKPGQYDYKFDNGKIAKVKVRMMNFKERMKLAETSKWSDKYNWIIDSIINNGCITNSE